MRKPQLQLILTTMDTDQSGTIAVLIDRIVAAQAHHPDIRGKVAKKETMQALHEEIGLHEATIEALMRAGFHSAQDLKVMTPDQVTGLQLPFYADVCKLQNYLLNPKGTGEKANNATEVLKKIEGITQSVEEELDPLVNAFRGCQTDRAYQHLDKSLTQAIFKLDKIEHGGVEEVRQARKCAVKYVHDLLSLLESNANTSDPILREIKQSVPPERSFAETALLEEERERLRVTLLTEERERERCETMTCKLCFDQEWETIFLPCGHLICCAECAEKTNDCPMCRGPIQQRKKVFMV